MTINNNTLYRLCNEKKYFTCGTNEQYEKLFELNELNTSTIELANIIWICSEKNISRKDILEELIKARLEDKKYEGFNNKID